MKLKAGVKLDGLKPEMFNLIPVIDYVFLNRVMHDCTITSTTDGKHKKGSFHYKGLAIDLRIRDLASDVEVRSVYNDLYVALHRLCDVVLESDHIHVEYSPNKSVY